MLSEREYLLICLAEECAEVQHRVSKALRFGLDEIEPGQDLNNVERLCLELTDLETVIEMIDEMGHIPGLSDNSFGDQVLAKQTKVRHFMNYSIRQGTLDPTIKEDPDV